MAKSFEIPNSVCTPRFNAQKPNLSYKDLKPKKNPYVQHKPDFHKISAIRERDNAKWFLP